MRRRYELRLISPSGPSLGGYSNQYIELRADARAQLRDIWRDKADAERVTASELAEKMRLKP